MTQVTFLEVFFFVVSLGYNIRRKKPLTRFLGILFILPNLKKETFFVNWNLYHSSHLIE